MREITRYRQKLVKLRTSVKDQVHGVLAELGIPVSAYDLTCRSAYYLTCWFAGGLAG